MHESIYGPDREAMGGSDPDPAPRQQFDVHCNRCNWRGFRKNIHQDLGCPMCLTDEHLEYRDKQDYLLAAKRLKQDLSPDGVKGFDIGVKWLQGYIMELLDGRGIN